MAELYDEGIMLGDTRNGVYLGTFRVIRVKENSDGSKMFDIKYEDSSETPFMTITENELNNKIDNGEIAILDIVKNGYLSDLPNEKVKEFIDPLVDTMIPKLKESLKSI